MESDNEFLTAEKLVEKGRKVIELDGGEKILIRRLKVAELAMFLKTVPDVSQISAMDPEKAAVSAEAQAIQGKAEEAIDRVCLASILKPKLYDDPEKGATPGDFPFVDRLKIFHAVLEFSKFGKAESEAVLPLSKTGG